MLNQQKELLRIQKNRKKLLEPFFSEDELIEGSYVEIYQKCGRAGCHCEEKPSHLVTRLSRWVDGKLKHKVVRIADRPQIKIWSNNYKKHKNAMAQLNKCNSQEKKIMNIIIELKKKYYE
ncbi:MAG: hypothetical protein GY714_29085 [Desulfobacterales bacterium]|nr:hypothetical protein [Desulfobacterales bacterium]